MYASIFMQHGAAAVDLILALRLSVPIRWCGTSGSPSNRFGNSFGGNDSCCLLSMQPCIITRVSSSPQSASMLAARGDAVSRFEGSPVARQAWVKWASAAARSPRSRALSSARSFASARLASAAEAAAAAYCGAKKGRMAVMLVRTSTSCSHFGPSPHGAHMPNYAISHALIAHPCLFRLHSRLCCCISRFVITPRRTVSSSICWPDLAEHGGQNLL